MASSDGTLRSIWQHEDEFTRWLARSENLSLLSAAVGHTLETSAIQKRVGSLIADLVCEFDSGDETALAIVEVQFTRSDHDHLSKLQFYAGNLNRSRLLIWIAPEFRREHLLTLELLNTRIAEWQFVPVQLRCSAGAGAYPEVELLVITAAEAVEAVPATARRRATGRPVSPDDYAKPELIAFITRFIAATHQVGSPLVAGDMLKPSAPSERPPFAQRNVTSSYVKLKGRVVPDDPHSLQVELLVRRRFVRDDDAYEACVEFLDVRSHPLVEGNPRLRGTKRTPDRETRFVIQETFERPVLAPDGERAAFEWLQACMEDFLAVFEPIVAEARTTFGR